MKEQLVDFLSTNFGTELYPKSDGRIEIPKNIVDFLGWNKCKTINIMFEDGNIYVSKYDFDENITINVPNGRVRIPARILKSAGLSKKNLIAVFDLGTTLRISASNCEYAVNEFVASLTKEQSTALLNISMGKSLKNNFISNMDIVKVSTSQESLPLPEMFLLKANENESFLFRPVSNPYKFHLCWKNGKPFLTKNGGLVVYALSGMKRTSNIAGYLLVDQTTFGKICYILNRKGESSAIGKDLIFMFSPKTRVGSFKVFENPKNDIADKDINRARLVCSNPEKFLLDNFEYYDGEDCDIPPTTLTTNTLKLKSDKNTLNKIKNIADGYGFNSDNVIVNGYDFNSNAIIFDGYDFLNRKTTNGE